SEDMSDSAFRGAYEQLSMWTGDLQSCARDYAVAVEDYDEFKAHYVRKPFLGRDHRQNTQTAFAGTLSLCNNLLTTDDFVSNPVRRQ
ncbi:hypothetical protein KIPB_014224, partial [Kipferlia bialata]